MLRAPPLEYRISRSSWQMMSHPDTFNSRRFGSRML